MFSLFTRSRLHKTIEYFLRGTSRVHFHLIDDAKKLKRSFSKVLEIFVDLKKRGRPKSRSRALTKCGEAAWV